MHVWLIKNSVISDCFLFERETSSSILYNSRNTAHFFRFSQLSDFFPAQNIVQLRTKPFPYKRFSIITDSLVTNSYCINIAHEEIDDYTIFNSTNVSKPNLATRGRQRDT
jgi:hypothetical protein